MRTCARFLAVLVAAGAIGRGEAAALTQQVEPGEALFQQKCVACHTIGQGDRVGPDLAGVHLRRDHAWLIRWISAPDQMLARGDPVAKALLRKYRNLPMPNQGLTSDQVAAVVAYLEAPPTGHQAAEQAAVAVPALPPGNASVGKALFSGTRRFQNAGPACLACHSIAGIGALGGGALGPDLTLAATNLGAAGLASVLASIPYPTMSPIFGRRPLTPEEQAHLAAFLQQAPLSGRSPRAVGLLSGAALVAMLALFGLAHLSWRGRLTTVRRRMVESGRSGSDPKRVSSR